MKVILNNSKFETSTYEIARSLDNEQFAHVIEDVVNCFHEDIGILVGRELLTTHRTLQRSAIVFALGIITGLSEQKYTDPRNETAIAVAKQIKAMLDDGTLNPGRMI
jgi:hypothetical protein